MKVLSALALAAFAVMAMPGSANARIYTKDIALQIVNNSQTPVHVSFCPNGHVSAAYQVGSRRDPCNVTPYSTTLAGNGGRLANRYEANPVGVVMRVNGKTIYFYASNPQIGKPFFEINGQKVSLVEGEMQVRTAEGVSVRFHREGDTDKKIMMIEILKV